MTTMTYLYTVDMSSISFAGPVVIYAFGGVD
jgi:hypothetical protein